MHNVVAPPGAETVLLRATEGGASAANLQFRSPSWVQSFGVLAERFSESAARPVHTALFLVRPCGRRRSTKMSFHRPTPIGLRKEMLRDVAMGSIVVLHFARLLKKD